MSTHFYNYVIAFYAVACYSMCEVISVPTAKSKAVRKYNAKTYERIEIVVPIGNKDKIKAAAERAGESVNAFINAAIQERMQKDAGN